MIAFDENGLQPITQFRSLIEAKAINHFTSLATREMN